MDWFGWRLPKDPAADKTAGPQAILQELGKRVPQYLDDVDQGRLIYPACKRAPSDAHGDIRSIWDDARLEALRYLAVVPRREFVLLSCLARSAGEVVSRTRIVEEVWDINFETGTNIVEATMRRLRAKIDDPFERPLIHNVRGVGYVLETR